MTLLAAILGSEPTVLLAVAAGAVLLVVDLVTAPRKPGKNPTEVRDRH